MDYPNAQFLMIGEAQDSLGKAATAEAGGKQAHEIQPGEELENLEQENEDRINALDGKALESASTLRSDQLTKLPARRHDHLRGFGLGCEEICRRANYLGF